MRAPEDELGGVVGPGRINDGAGVVALVYRGQPGPGPLLAGRRNAACSMRAAGVRCTMALRALQPGGLCAEVTICAGVKHHGCEPGAAAGSVQPAMRDVAMHSTAPHACRQRRDASPTLLPEWLGLVCLDADDHKNDVPAAPPHHHAVGCTPTSTQSALAHSTTEAPNAWIQQRAAGCCSALRDPRR